MAFVIGIINKGISTTVGLAAEKYYDHKDRKTVLAIQGSPPNTSQEHLDPDDRVQSDEQDWALDEAADPPDYETSEAHSRPAAERTISELVHDTVSIAPSQAQPSPACQLPYPIVIPQRRPGTKTRGFARAYPPDLAPFGIDQDTFFRFLQNFHSASQASPWLNALYISAGIVGFVPGVITLAVSISVQLAAGTAIELQGRYKANAFLDQVNKELFMPLGLYAMVLMYKPDGPGTETAPAFGVETVNLETAKFISKWGLPKNPYHDEHEVSTKAKILRPIRESSGRTAGEAMMPLEVAPLVYPGLEDLVERPNVVRDESFKARLQRNKKFVGEYFDRRAAASYTGNNPNTILTQSTAPSQTQFRSRFADPNHPCNNGHLLSLITGGKYIAQPLGSRRLREVGEDGKLKPEPRQKIRGPIGLIGHGVRKVLSPSILYLTIVNLPSEEDMAEAKAMLDKDGKGIKELLKELRERKQQ
ncbi:uncharacterized protein BDR25DRAFT_297942 [Lindgomyces ingoldianus]|uniref:Uncharacterized protein n=1 Tax=Lindgomyces ingoldianus TaxID=673940 RepID=A0ACB6Q937_9PLEO|nr:uncharacterized protein BDR25DRAFT_297942 [Lindgomyces ingoldianus]KAF2463419.1 hypothetical protein BDR25DRAFT_297942 [Lindgomyces ingoldianus]